MLVFNWDKIGIDSISDDKIIYAHIQLDANMFLNSKYSELHRNLVMSLMPQFEQYTDDKTCFVFELCNVHNLDEDDFSKEITSCLEKYNPDILVITGHDSFKKNKDKNNLSSYQNSNNFVKATVKAREYERNQDKLIIIAGACQSFYEDLIKAGANFASSPKRINIHALDPAIIASAVALSPKNKEIDLISLLDKTHYGSDGMGGIITNGVMYVGYPR